MSTKLKKIIFLLVFFSLFSFEIFAATKNITLISGYDDASKSLNAFGISSNTSSATIECLDSLSSVVEQELRYRVANIYRNFADSNSRSLDFFLRGISANMSVILRSMLKRAKCSATYLSDREDVVVCYVLDVNDFEDVFDSYIDKFNLDGDEMQTYTKEIKNINRFFRFKYKNSNQKVLRVQV